MKLVVLLALPLLSACSKKPDTTETVVPPETSSTSTEPAAPPPKSNPTPTPPANATCAGQWRVTLSWPKNRCKVPPGDRAEGEFALRVYKSGETWELEDLPSELDKNDLVMAMNGEPYIAEAKESGGRCELTVEVENQERDAIEQHHLRLALKDDGSSPEGTATYDIERDGESCTEELEIEVKRRTTKR